MFRPMRRIKQQLPDEEAIQILETNTAGVLAVLGDDDYPYAVPLSYAYQDGKLFFHSAVSGHKIDSIQNHDKVSFCVIRDDLVVAETFTTHYRSVIAFGRARILKDSHEKQHALECLVRKYSPSFFSKGQAEIKNDWNQMVAVEIKIERLTGKAAIELINQ